MQLKVSPASELTLSLIDESGTARIGRLEALIIDLSKSKGLFSLPKIKLVIGIESKAFNGDTNKEKAVIEKAKDYSFLQINHYR